MPFPTFRRAALLIIAGLPLGTSVAAGSAPPTGTMERLEAGKAVELIVEFRAESVAQEAEMMREASGRHFEDDFVLETRKERYARIKADVGAALAGHKIDMLRDYSHLPMGLRRFRSTTALRAFLARNEVLAVYENRALHAVLTQSLPLIGQSNVSSAGLKGSGTTVAVIDGGIDYTLPAFGSCTAPGTPSTCRVAASLDFGSGDSDTSHGTHVAATVLGVAPEARIAALNAFSGDTALSSDIIEAINWSIANRSTYNIAAINMSLGDGVKYTAACSSGNPFATPITNAINAGMAVVVATGNEAYTNGISSPACVPGTIAVGAVYDANAGSVNWGLCTDATTAADKVTCFSNSSSLLTLWAPGALITAGGTTMGGTSQAAPHVAGAIAVLRAAYPGESQSATRTRLTSTGTSVTDSRNSITKPRLNLLAAARPANDAFASRTALSGSSGSTTGTTALATEESGEPDHGGSGGAHSVWWKWTAPAVGQVSLNTAGSGFDTLLAVHTGTAVASLTDIAGNDNASPLTTSSLLFQAQAGIEYQIAVDGANGAAGAVALAWSLNTAAKANLSVSIAGPTMGMTGDGARYTITAANAGPQTATRVVVTIALPGSASIISVPSGCSTTDTVVTCTHDTLASGASATFEIMLTWTGAASTSISSAIASDLPDANADDNSTSLAVTVNPVGDVPTLPLWGMLALGTLLGGMAIGRKSAWPEQDASTSPGESTRPSRLHEEGSG